MRNPSGTTRQVDGARMNGNFQEGAVIHVLTNLCNLLINLRSAAKFRPNLDVDVNV
jgi:hypothetical protein